MIRGLPSILCKNAQSMLKTVIIRHGEAHSKPTWFDKECYRYQYKRVVRQSLHKHSNNPNEANKKTYVSLRREYKILLKVRDCFIQIQKSYHYAPISRTPLYSGVK